MKSGKYVKLEKQKSITLSYGSVNTKNLKSVYLRFQCWVEPKDEDEDWDRIIQAIRKEIKVCTYQTLDRSLFSNNYIVDLDLRSSGIQKEKRSFLSCEITLYTLQQSDIRSDEFYGVMDGIATTVLSNCPTLFNTFNIFERKR